MRTVALWRIRLPPGEFQNDAGFRGVGVIAGKHINGQLARVLLRRFTLAAPQQLITHILSIRMLCGGSGFLDSKLKPDRSKRT